MSTCFICLESATESKRFKQDKGCLKSLIVTASKLLKIKGISDDEWDFVDNLQTALCCNKCTNGLVTVKIINDQLLEIQQQLKECLAKLEESVRKSAATEKAKACLLWSSCFKFRNELTSRKIINLPNIRGVPAPTRQGVSVPEPEFDKDNSPSPNVSDAEEEYFKSQQTGNGRDRRGKRKLVIIAEEDESLRTCTGTDSVPRVKLEPGEARSGFETTLQAPKINEAYAAASYLDGDEYISGLDDGDDSDTNSEDDESKSKRNKPSSTKKSRKVKHLEYGKRKWICVVENCGVEYTSKNNWLRHCDREHPGVEVQENVKWLGTPPPSPNPDDSLGNGGPRFDVPFQVITDNLFLYKHAIFVEFNKSRLSCKAMGCKFQVPFDYYESFQKLRQHIEDNHRGSGYRSKPNIFCRICNSDHILSHQAFRDHLKNIHPEFGARGKGIGVCDCCLRHMNYIQVMAHMFSHKNPKEVAIARALGLGPKRARKLRKFEMSAEERDRKKTIVCPHCSHRTYNRNDLQKHINSKHTAKDDRKDFNICPECGTKVFGSKYCMDRHMNKFHPQPDVVQNILHCPHCDKKFIWEERFLLKVHLKEHNAWNDPSKPFGCEKCKKSFAMKSALKTHFKKVHKQSSKR